MYNYFKSFFKENSESLNEPEFKILRCFECLLLEKDTSFANQFPSIGLSFISFQEI